MRLVCPNCEAKYEVPEDAIPETGRDVQCANCGHSWYQMRSRAAAEPAAAPAPAPVAAPAPIADAAPVATPEAEVVARWNVSEPADPVAEVPPEEPAIIDAAAADPVAEPAPEAEVVPVIETPSAAEVEVEAEVLVAGDAAEPEIASDAPATPEAVAEEAPSAEVPVETPAGAEDDAAIASVGVIPAIEAAVVEALVAEEAAEDAAETAVADLADTAAAAPAAYAVDESVLAILREEAEREAQARRAEAAKPVETQVELGIESAISARPAEFATIAAAPVAAAAVAAADPTRRTRLPDVEEINSTLRPTETVSEDGTAAEAAPVEGRSSFRSGFLLVMTVAILGSALYGSADALASAVPALAGPLQAYVSFVDSLRLHLDGLMQSATVAINGT